MEDHKPKTVSGLARHYMKDLIYGANDGVITTFAVVAGVAGAELSHSVVIILGIANLVADGFSMGASNYLAHTSEEAVRVSEGKDIGEPYPVRHAAATFLSFVIAGSVPLMAYFLRLEIPFQIATLLAAATLFAVGSSRALVTKLSWWVAGLEMLSVGAAAGALAYFIGGWVKGLA